MIRVSFIVSSLVVFMLEPQADREPETAARWERSDVDVSRYLLISEVAHFRVHPGVVGERQEITAAQAQLCGSHSPAEPRNHRRRKLEGKSYFPKLHERSVFDIDAGLPAEHPQSIGSDRRLQRAHRDRVGKVFGVLAKVVKELGQVDDASAVLPVEQAVQPQSLEPQIATERHVEVGVCVADLADDGRPVRQAVVPDYLSRRCPLGDLERAEGGSEAANSEGRNGKIDDLAPSRRVRRTEHPFRCSGLDRNDVDSDLDAGLTKPAAVEDLDAEAG